MVNLGKVHGGCEEPERHLTKLRRPSNGMLCAFGYLQLSTIIQWEGTREEREERVEGVVNSHGGRLKRCLFNKEQKT